MDFSLLQPHTISLYHLRDKSYSIERVKAKSLLYPQRYDLYAKLYYARNRFTNPTQARRVYLEHIKAFNPDGKEPGRDDKNSFDDFVRTFDSLLDFFKENQFDDKKSIVPVGSDGIILDGGHRVAALAFYDKEITIARFKDVVSVCQFDYSYFKLRGLSQEISDVVALEILLWTQNCFVACLWPKIDDGEKGNAIEFIKGQANIFYTKSVNCSLSYLSTFISKVYRKQSWVGDEQNGYAGAKDKALNCYKRGSSITFLFFHSTKPLKDILALKEEVRCFYPYDKHSLHITDNDEETKDIAYYVLSKEGLSEWLYKKSALGTLTRLKDSIQEKIYIFRHVHWIRFKTFLYSCIIRK